ncbi:DUF1501 domain-containing protein [Enterovibrio norvegicus]|uniref:DUF1501 domain-containing protein n=1 Tax=Enterovibrio norvegicus TaxID=188144 RepID=UPI000C81F499|nr:DUF1501 domain-containing protein [Enterovibrio norvegicus]PML77363.1 hypothetical protein BCT69_20210 [Enterovibrio norvegicus]
MKVTRRNFIQGAGAIGISAFVPSLSFNVHASESDMGYKALVCVFFKGGNDFFHQVVPEDKNNSYYTTRSSIATDESWSSGLKDQSGNLINVHQKLKPLDGLFNNRNANLVLNVGTLLKETNREQHDNPADFIIPVGDNLSERDILEANPNSLVLPKNLFAHNKQQEIWQRSFKNHLGEHSELGWLGEALGELQPPNVSKKISNSFYTASNELLDSDNIPPFSVNRNGFDSMLITNQAITKEHYDNISGFNYLSVNGEDRSLSPLSTAYSNVMKEASRYSKDLHELFGRPTSDKTPLYEINTNIKTDTVPKTDAFEKQIREVKRIIDAKASASLSDQNKTRQVFFVELEGFDTHSDQIDRQEQLMIDFASVIASFYTELGGDADCVMTCTLSEFGRTMHTNARGGTDHGWGGGQFMFGPSSAVGLSNSTDNRCFGSYPDFKILDENGLPIINEDDNGDGRLIPKISHEQYAAHMLHWLELNDDQINNVFPLLLNGEFMSNA